MNFVISTNLNTTARIQNGFVINYEASSCFIYYSKRFHNLNITFKNSENYQGLNIFQSMTYKLRPMDQRDYNVSASSYPLMMSDHLTINTFKNFLDLNVADQLGKKRFKTVTFKINCLHAINLEKFIKRLNADKIILQIDKQDVYIYHQLKLRLDHLKIKKKYI
jgi:hypothetical protein